MNGDIVLLIEHYKKPTIVILIYVQYKKAQAKMVAELRMCKGHLFPTALA